jgi:anti-sigma regulatory factor (Ser/Thr protein kinase)
MKFEYNIIKNDYNTAGTASSNIKKVLKLLGIDQSIIRRASIAAYEAEMNIAIHSNGGQISLCIESDKFKIIAEDKGPGIIDIERAMEEGYSTATTEVREMGFGAGMGLPNMKKCSDIFNISSELGLFTRVEMTLLITGGGNNE